MTCGRSRTCSLIGLTSPAAPGVNATKFLNVHSITIQVPISSVTRSGHPSIGVWTTASRQRVRVWDADSGSNWDSGPFRQVSRLGNPLFNEVLVPISKKDLWNSLPPSDDKQFAGDVTQPGLAGLLPVLYPGVFPNLAALVKSGKPRADLEAILLTGIPSGIIPGFPNFTGPVLADMLRLNTSIPPTPAGKQSIYGLLGGDAGRLPERPAGDGRRGGDRTAGDRRGHLPADRQDVQARRRRERGHRRADSRRHRHPHLSQFPYLGIPYDGYDHPDPSPSS